MHTHTLRKKLGAHLLLVVFLATLFISVFAPFMAAPTAHALDSLSGNNSNFVWIAPTILQYTDAKGHKINFFQDGKDASGGGQTWFTSETIASYLTHNNDSEICDTGIYDTTYNQNSRHPGGKYPYPINPEDSKLKSDTNPAARGYIQGITQNPSTFHIDAASGYARFGGCGSDSGGDEPIYNKRPPQIGTVAWTSPYTMQASSVITAPKSPPNYNNTWDPNQDSWVEPTVPVNQEFDQSTNESNGVFSLTQVGPLPSSAPTNCGMDVRIDLNPYVGASVPYPYVPVYIPHVVNSNGTFCTDDPLAGYALVVKGTNATPARPTPPPIDNSITASWADINTLQTSGALTDQNNSTILDSGAVFKNSSVNNNDMVLTDGDAPLCGTTHDTLEVNPYKLAPYAQLTTYDPNQNGHCISTSIWIALTTPYPTSSVDNTGGGGNNGGSSSGNDTFGTSCPIKGDGDWLFCMIAGVFSGAIDMLSKGLDVLLYTPVDQIFTGQIQTVFNSFRNIGVAILVIVGLFMVLSQAAGLEIFAAYTVRKALPRLVLAMIGMSLAWPVLQFIVTLFNDLGVWAMQLILSTTAGITQGSPLGNFQVSSTVLFITAVGGGLIFATGIIMSYLGTLLLALLVGFIVLAIRQMIVLIAIVMAPLAIAASILPSTQKIWSFWRETLLTALAMFPIIMAFLGAGKAMSVIAGAAAEGTPDAGRSFTWKLLSVTCLIAALAAIPFAFRIAGGLVGAAHSLVTGSKLGKGAFGFLSDYRGRQLSKRWNDAKTGNFWRTGNAWWQGGKFADAAAKFGSRRVQGAALSVLEPNKARRQALRSALSYDTAMAAAEKDPNVHAILGNDDYMFAITRSDGSTGGIRRALRDINPGYTEAEVGAVSNAVRSIGYDNMRKLAAARLPGTGTAFKGPDEGGAAMLETLNQAFTGPGGFDKLGFSRALAAAREGGNQARRYELGSAGSYTDNLIWAQELRNAGPVGSAAYEREKASIRKRMDEKTILTVNPGMIANMRKSGLERLLPTIVEQFETARDIAMTTGDGEQLDNMSALVANLYDEMSRSAKENAALLADGVMKQQLEFTVPVPNQPGVTRQETMTVQNYIDNVARTHGRFQQWRREYASRSEQLAQQQALAAGAQQQQQPPGGGGNPTH